MKESNSNGRLWSVASKLGIVWVVPLAVGLIAMSAQCDQKKPDQTRTVQDEPSRAQIGQTFTLGMIQYQVTGAFAVRSIQSRRLTANPPSGFLWAVVQFQRTWSGPNPARVAAQPFALRLANGQRVNYNIDAMSAWISLTNCGDVATPWLSSNNPTASCSVFQIPENMLEGASLELLEHVHPGMANRVKVDLGRLQIRTPDGGVVAAQPQISDASVDH